MTVILPSSVVSTHRGLDCSLWPSFFLLSDDSVESWSSFGLGVASNEFACFVDGFNVCSIIFSSRFHITNNLLLLIQPSTSV
jgi:hypothetical protein